MCRSGQGLTLFFLDLNLPTAMAGHAPYHASASFRMPIVVLTGNSDEQMALATIQQGARIISSRGR